MEKIASNFFFELKGKYHSAYNLVTNLKKGSMSINEYFLKYKEIIDAVGLVGHLLSEENQILQVLAGLGQDYDPIVALVSFTRDS